MPEIPSNLGVYQPYNSPARGLGPPHIDPDLAGRPSANVAAAARGFEQSAFHLGREAAQRDAMERQMQAATESVKDSALLSSDRQHYINQMIDGKVTYGQVDPDAKLFPKEKQGPIEPEDLYQAAALVHEQALTSGMEAIGKKYGVYGQERFLEHYTSYARDNLRHVQGIRDARVHAKYTQAYMEGMNDITSRRAQGIIDQSTADSLHHRLDEDIGQFMGMTGPQGTAIQKEWQDRFAMAPFEKIMLENPNGASDIIKDSYNPSSDVGKLPIDKRKAVVDLAIQHLSKLSSIDNAERIRTEHEQGLRAGKVFTDALATDDPYAILERINTDSGLRESLRYGINTHQPALVAGLNARIKHEAEWGKVATNQEDLVEGKRYIQQGGTDLNSFRDLQLSPGDHKELLNQAIGNTLRIENKQYQQAIHRANMAYDDLKSVSGIYNNMLNWNKDVQHLVRNMKNDLTLAIEAYQDAHNGSLVGFDSFQYSQDLYKRYLPSLQRKAQLSIDTLTKSLRFKDSSMLIEAYKKGEVSEGEMRMELLRREQLSDAIAAKQEKMRGEMDIEGGESSGSSSSSTPTKKSSGTSTPGMGSFEKK